VQRARALSAVLASGLVAAILLGGCGKSNATRSTGDASSGGPAGGDQSSSSSGESPSGGAPPTSGRENGGSGGNTLGGTCENCAAGNAGETSSAPNACNATADTTPNVPAPTSLDPDSVARAATVVGSCIPDDGVARNAAHIWLAHFDGGLGHRFAAQLNCLANATCGCQAVMQCLGWSYAPLGDACITSCEGPVLHACGDGAKVNVDCAAFGLVCDPEAGCIEGNAESCSTEKPSCTADGEVRFCDDGFMRETPCASLGFSCVDGKCTGKGDACSADPSPQPDAAVPIGTGCRGDVLEACLGGKATTLDCAAQGPGFTCQTIGDAHFCGLGSECVPADNYRDVSGTTCDGALLTFCNAGRREQIDCRALGFDDCDVDAKQDHYGCTPVLSLTSD